MTDPTYAKIISRNLRRIALENGKTQADIARDLKINKATISSWMNATRVPRIDKMDLLCQYFHCKRSDLMEDYTDEAERNYMSQIDAQLNQEELLQKLCELHKINIHADMNYLYVTFPNGQKYAITHEDWKIISMKFPRLFEDVISLVDKFPMLLTSTNNQKEAQTESPN